MDTAIIDELCYSNGLVFERAWLRPRGLAVSKDFPTGDTWDEAMQSLLPFPPKQTWFQLNHTWPAAVIARQRATTPADDIDK